MKRPMSTSRSQRSMAQSLWIGSLILMVLLAACRPISPNGVRLTPGTPSATPKESPTPRPTFTPAPVRLDPFITLCLIKPKTTASLVNFYTEPEESAALIRKLRNREVLTVTMRSLDESWVHGTTKDLKEGWVQSPNVACTVPIHELYVSPNTGTIADVTATAAVIATSKALLAGTPTLTPEGGENTATPIPATNTPTTPPTDTPIPATETPLATPTLPISTDTPTPAATSTVPPLPEILCSVTITSGLNVRIGPATTYQAFVKLAQNETFTAIGRNADNTWLAGRTAEGRPGWIYAVSARCVAPTDQLPVLAANAILNQITPTPGPEQAQPTATITPPSPTLTATLAVTTAIATPEVTATVSVVTATPALTITLTPSTQPTATAASPSLNCTVGVSNGVYMRTGPARTFPSLGIAGRGEPYVALARSANNTWIFGRSKAGILGWSIAGGVRCPAQFRSLPISRQLLPTPTPKPQ